MEGGSREPESRYNPFMTHVPPPFEIPEVLLEELKTLGPLLDLGNETYNFGRSIFEQSLRGKSPDSDFKIVAYLIFTKSFRTFQAVQNLCRCGLGSDAISLCGSLFENYINLRYIEKAPVRRSRRYLQYEQVEKYYQARKVLRRKRLPIGLRKEYRNYESKLDRQVCSLLDYFPKKSLGWSQKKLADRATAVKATLEYDTLYWVFCGHKHTLPMVAADSIFKHTGGLDFLYGASIKGVYHACKHSAEYFLKLCDVFGHIYQLGIRSDFSAMYKRLQKVAEDIFQAHPRLCD